MESSGKPIQIAPDSNAEPAFEKDCRNPIAFQKWAKIRNVGVALVCGLILFSVAKENHSSLLFPLLNAVVIAASVFYYLRTVASTAPGVHILGRRITFSNVFGDEYFCKIDEIKSISYLSVAFKDNTYLMAKWVLNKDSRKELKARGVPFVFFGVVEKFLALGIGLFLLGEFLKSLGLDSGLGLVLMGIVLTFVPGLFVWFKGRARSKKGKPLAPWVMAYASYGFIFGYVANNTDFAALFSETDANYQMLVTKAQFMTSEEATELAGVILASNPKPSIRIDLLSKILKSARKANTLEFVELNAAEGIQSTSDPDYRRELKLIQGCAAYLRGEFDGPNSRQPASEGMLRQIAQACRPFGARDL